MKNTKKAFTLVELIVVITILAILSTIGYLYLNNYTVDARDTARLTDINSINKTLKLYHTKRGEYPTPSNATNITYSGGIVWTQGEYGDSLVKDTEIINKAPKDPLWGNNYTYSVSSTKNMYNITYVTEGAYKATSYNPIINDVYAGGIKEYTSKVSGDYNGQIINTSTGGKVYVFAAPSLIASDLSNTNILSLTNKFVFDNEVNIAPVYDGVISPSGSFEFTPTLVYSGSSLPRTPTQLKGLITNLKNAISGTVLYSNTNYKDIVELDINNTEELFKYGQKYINEDLGGRFELKYPKTCKEVQSGEDNHGSGFYTISPSGSKKVEVYCDMDTDGGGWTRIRKRDRVNGSTEGTDITKTRGFQGTEVMVTYTRYGKIRKNISGTWTTIDVTGKKYGFQYKRFDTKQTQETGLCGEHTGISKLVAHITGGSWGDCSRSCQRNDPNDPSSGCNGDLEYNDIQIDDLGKNTGLTNDKVLAGFDPDPCIDNGHKTTDRNTSWAADGRMVHRIDSSTSLISIGGNSSRCAGIAWTKSWLDDRGTDWLNDRGIDDTTAFKEGFDTMEVWVR